MHSGYCYIGNRDKGYHVGKTIQIKIGHEPPSSYCIPVHDSELVHAQYIDEYIEATGDSRSISELVMMRKSLEIGVISVEALTKERPKGVIELISCAHCLSYIGALKAMQAVHN